MMEYEGKRVIILGGAGVHIKVVEAAKEMGLYTIVTDYLLDSPAKRIADESLMFSVLDVDGIVEWCKQNPVDGVVNFCNDPAQIPHQQICERLGLPCYGNVEQVYALTNKQKFKRLCAENGVDTIPMYIEDDVASNRIEYPVIVKPVDSRGSRGLTLCCSKEQVINALETAKKESRSGQAIIEKYMGKKQDFTMTYIFSDGKASLIRTADRYLGKSEDGLEKQCICSISPSRNSKMYIENVHDRVVKMLQNLGIENGPVFMQGFIDDDTVRFYDPGIRFPGADYEKLFMKATDMNPMKLILSYAVSGTMKNYEGRLAEGYKLNGKCSVQLLIAAKAGKIASFEGINEIQELPYVVTVSQKAEIGDVIPASGDVKQRIAEIVVLVEDKPEEIREAINTIQHLLKVQDEQGHNMLVSQADLDSIILVKE